jgi:Domain of unknown function (DUF4365)
LTKAELHDVRGERGEKILFLRLTDYAPSKPLFRPGFLGDKWPSVDYLVELRSVRKRTPYFLAQAKSTGATLSKTARNVSISTKRRDIERLLRLPGPTYIFGIHEPSQRVFVRSVHRGEKVKAITRIPLSHELTRENLRSLHKEVREFWAGVEYKPRASVFA